MTGLAAQLNSSQLRRLASGEWAWRFVLVAVFSALAFVQAFGFRTAPAWDADEGTYAAQAWAVQNWGDLAHYTYWYDHPPVGWMLVAGWAFITGAFERGDGISAIREFVLVLQVVSGMLLYVIARRLSVRRSFALIGVVAFSLSPLALHYHRIGYLDNIMMPFLLGAFALALSPKGQLWAIVASAALFAVAVLIKETTFVFAPALVLLMWQQVPRPTRLMTLSLAATFFFSITGLYLLFAILKGELIPGDGHVSLLEAAKWQLADRAGSGSVFDGGSVAGSLFGRWRALDFWLVDLAVVLMPLMLAVRRFRFVGVGTAIWVVLLLRTGYLPEMFIIALLPFAALSIAATLELVARINLPQGAWEPLRERFSGAYLAIAAVLAAAVFIGPSWSEGNRNLLSAENTGQQSSSAFLLDHVPRDSKLLVDNIFWVDLVEDGFEPDDTVWFYKLETDPEVVERFPNGYEDLDFVVSTVAMRAAPEPEVQRALRASDLLVAYGDGADRVEIRTVGDTVASAGLIAAAGRYPQATVADLGVDSPPDESLASTSREPKPTVARTFRASSPRLSDTIAAWRAWSNAHPGQVIESWAEVEHRRRGLAPDTRGRSAWVSVRVDSVEQEPPPMSELTAWLS